MLRSNFQPLLYITCGIQIVCKFVHTMYLPLTMPSKYTSDYHKTPQLPIIHGIFIITCPQNFINFLGNVKKNNLKSERTKLTFIEEKAILLITN